MTLDYPLNDRLWLKNLLAILADNAQGGIVIEGQKILELVPQGQQLKSTYKAVMDCNELVILLGLINGHHHFYQTLTRALAQALNKPLFGWLKSLYPVWAGLEADMLYPGYTLSLSRAIAKAARQRQTTTIYFLKHLHRP